MVTALVGTNTFLLQRRLSELTAKFVTANGELALERFDGGEDEAKSIIEAINNLPFLTNRKMVVVRNGQLNSDFVEQVEQIISSIPEWCDLILYEPQIDRRSSYFKVLKSKTELEDFSELDPHQLAKWLVDEAKKSSYKLGFADANYLITRVGPDQIGLYHELQKLATYSPEISRQIIDELTEPIPKSRVFDLLDAAFDGQKQRAISLYEEQRAQKVEPQAILAMILWQLNLVALALTGKGKPTAEIARDSGSGEFPIKKAASLAKKMDSQRLSLLIDGIYEIDFKSKTQTYNLDEALKTYLVSI